MNLFRLKNSNSTNPKSNGRGLLLVGLVLACFGLSPASRAALPPPPPDGGYPIANTAEGDGALSSVTVSIYPPAGFANTALGYQALNSSTTGNGNTATGAVALQSNTTGSGNTANGEGALASSTTSDDNTATGFGALQSTTGNDNTANGSQALHNNTTGSGNIALGFQAGLNLTTGDNNIDIGDTGVAAEANTIRIGTAETHTNAYIAGIYNTTVVKGVGVVVDAAGHLGTKGSSERFKAEIKPMDKASQAILALKPVTFRYKQELDPDGTPQFGLLAEEVEKVSPDLVARDDRGKVYTVRYEAVNAMLLNEFLKEHRRVEQQEATITQLKRDLRATITELNARLKEQDSKIEKVSAQVEVSKSAPQMALNN
jgi:hypothetical protein